MLVDNMDEKNSHAVSVTFTSVYRDGEIFISLFKISRRGMSMRENIIMILWQEELGLFSDAEKGITDLI